MLRSISKWKYTIIFALFALLEAIAFVSAFPNLWVILYGAGFVCFVGWAVHSYKHTRGETHNA